VNWQSGLINKLADRITMVNFTPDGVDVGGIMRCGGTRLGNVLELAQIWENPREALQFSKDGGLGPSPCQIGSGKCSS